jgi:hypothetical protein
MEKYDEVTSMDASTDLQKTQTVTLEEIGKATEETKGLFFGSIYEISILPLRLI